MKNIKILLVDDEEKIVEVVKLYLEKEGYEVITSTNGKDALVKYQQESPNLIVLDLMLPDLTGEEVCRTIRDESSVPIIMLTAKIDENSVLNGFDIGADDYILKPFSPKQLLARVKAVLRRTDNNVVDNKIEYNHGDLCINFHLYEVYRNHEKVELTPIEFKLLALFAKNPQQVFTRDAIIQSVYQDNFDGYDRAIDSHIKNLRKKLKDTPPKYILTVFGVGYKFGGEMSA